MVLHLPFPQKVSRSPRMCISKDPKDTRRIKTVELLLLRWEPEPERRWDVEDGEDRQKGEERNTQVRHRTQREAAGQNDRTVQLRHQKRQFHFCFRESKHLGMISGM